MCVCVCAHRLGGHLWLWLSRISVYLLILSMIWSCRICRRKRRAAAAEGYSGRCYFVSHRNKDAVEMNQLSVAATCGPCHSVQRIETKKEAYGCDAGDFDIVGFR